MYQRLLRLMAIYCKFDRAFRKISHAMRFIGVRFHSRLWNFPEMSNTHKILLLNKKRNKSLFKKYTILQKQKKVRMIVWSLNFFKKQKTDCEKKFHIFCMCKSFNSGHERNVHRLLWGFEEEKGALLRMSTYFRIFHLQFLHLFCAVSLCLSFSPILISFSFFLVLWTVRQEKGIWKHFSIFSVKSENFVSFFLTIVEFY